ncbi:MAG TPA: DNA-binding domain-containing protein [Gammaproteobacteria bacterium]|nr:DNA-binding domain-containing protein [Gammaproteobacteria bacterium]
MHNTPSLPELQRQFAAAMLGGAPMPLNAWVLGKGLTPEARLQIYRNIVFNNHAAALRTAYPVVLKLVGEDFFENAAARYLRGYPTRSGNLQDYGINFAEFLAQMPEVAGLVYLPDVARLEWARQESYLEADAEPIAITVLADVEEPEILRLQLHPSLRLLTSAYPVLDIWLFCQQSTTEHLDLSGKQKRVLVWRDGAQVSMQAVDAGTHALIAALLHGTPLAGAHADAMRAAKEFDLSACLHWLFTTGLVTSLTAS